MKKANLWMIFFTIASSSSILFASENRLNSVIHTKDIPTVYELLDYESEFGINFKKAIERQRKLRKVLEYTDGDFKGDVSVDIVNLLSLKSRLEEIREKERIGAQLVKDIQEKIKKVSEKLKMKQANEAEIKDVKDHIREIKRTKSSKYIQELDRQIGNNLVSTLEKYNDHIEDSVSLLEEEISRFISQLHNMVLEKSNYFQNRQCVEAEMVRLKRDIINKFQQEVGDIFDLDKKLNLGAIPPKEFFE